MSRVDQRKKIVKDLPERREDVTLLALKMEEGAVIQDI